MASAVVARRNAQDLEYLVSANGQTVWANATEAAEQFASLRDAVRASMRLPSTWRAFALPIETHRVS